jgi:hypothetical protein
MNEVRSWTPVEHRLASEFVTKVFPNDRYILRCRLGSIDEKWKASMDPDLAERIFKVTKKWADAVVLRPSEVIIIESKVFAKGVALYQLQEYARLFTITPDFQKHVGKSIRKLLQCAVLDPDVVRQAPIMGVEVWEYRPTWILPVLMQRYGLEVPALDEPRRIA